jgi:hypothetical protein
VPQAKRLLYNSTLGVDGQDPIAPLNAASSVRRKPDRKRVQIPGGSQPAECGCKRTAEDNASSEQGRSGPEPEERERRAAFSEESGEKRPDTGVRDGQTGVNWAFR